MEEENFNEPKSPESQQGDVIGSEVKLTEGQIEAQIEADDAEDENWDTEDDFKCCDNCDLPDACADFGCAIKAGIKKPIEW